MFILCSFAIVIFITLNKNLYHISNFRFFIWKHTIMILKKIKNNFVF